MREMVKFLRVSVVVFVAALAVVSVAQARPALRLSGARAAAQHALEVERAAYAKAAAAEVAEEPGAEVELIASAVLEDCDLNGPYRALCDYTLVMVAGDSRETCTGTLELTISQRGRVWVRWPEEQECVGGHRPEREAAGEPA